MSNEAKVRIGGDAKGATGATDAVAKSLKGAGDAATKAGKQSADAADLAAKAELRHEAEVQKAIQRLKQKESQANATAEAMKRLGIASDRSSRAAVSAPMAGGGGGFTLAGGAQGLARLGGAAGGVAGGLASSLGNAVPAVMALGIGAAAVGVSLRALSAASERQAVLAGDIVKAEQARQAVIEQGTKQLGANALGASMEGGAALRGAIARGGSIGGIAALGDQTGTSASQAAEIADAIRDITGEDRKAVIEAVRNSVKLGVDPVKTAQELAGFSARNKKGDLAAMDRLSVLGNAGNLFDNFSDVDIANATASGPGRDFDLSALHSLAEFSTRGSRAGLATLTPEGVRAADATTAEGARRIADPIGTALSEHAKQLKREVDVLEAMAKAEHPLIKGLTDLTAALRGGRGSYAQQARDLQMVNGR
jgi:hypothetical protein